jgi:type IV secretion system protein VirB1
VILSLVLFTQLAASCGPTVHVDTLAAVASTESQFNTLAIGDNTGGRSYAPATLQEAIVTATALLQQGHSLDLGLMQINSANLRGLGLSVADTFDPCKSIAGGTRVLVEGYRPAPGENTQAALLRALSHYNTGSQGRGFANGYVTRVQASAEQIVPAIRLGGTAGVNPADPPAPPPPPSWDVYGRARYLREQGGMIFGGSRPAPAPAPVPQATPQPAAPVQLQPVQLQANTSVAGDVR